MTTKTASAPAMGHSPQHDHESHRDQESEMQVAASVFATSDMRAALEAADVSGNVLVAQPPIRICVLGEFGVSIDGGKVPVSKNMPRVPWQLLKCLVTHGSRAVRQERLAEFLWPDADGDAAYRALITTTFRLRRLLGRKDALIFQNRSLSLEPTLCWVDAWEFERAIVDSRNLTEVQRGLALYRGAFLGGACDHGYEIGAREHLQRKYLRAVLACTDHLMRKSMFEEAAACLEAAIEAEPDLPVLHERLRDLSLHTGRVAPAMLSTPVPKSNAHTQGASGDPCARLSGDARRVAHTARGG